MPRKIFLMFISLIILSCSASKNEFGRSRTSLNKFSFIPLENYNGTIQRIDTSQFYVLRLDENVIKARKNSNISLDIIEGLKFYDNGKVGYFKEVDLNDCKALNPKKAIMGIYRVIDKKIQMEFYVNNPQRGHWIFKEDIVTISKRKDSLISNVSETGEIFRYSGLKLNKECLMYKPDW